MTSIVWKPPQVENYMLPDEPLQNNDLNAGIELSMTVSYIFSDQNSKVNFLCPKSAQKYSRHLNVTVN